ncbi:phosphatidylinositol-3-phosphatase myotubularin-2-like [Olea europaea var. sylvestris]|uniref:Phosphatidylinositol-3-phosphatase myotubularin-1 isoform X2 n=1 Tax=Olea europaea subsp. europaea TaxID=158383 RepID=A0A8S0TSQ1_OLEEU|nr:phosphatidylinositol-3-phosphatase myotubularin-2-like [Olea europaea var. sylvestris]CAA3007936.1 phosphatidylinositol-3-phosphatase myotubularin-1 isoform X2 [Olea europaea subsp. europaea]
MHTGIPMLPIRAWSFEFNKLAKEVAESKVICLPSSPLRFTNEKISSSSAWNLAERAKKESAAIKRAMQSLGCKVYFSEDGECVGIENNISGFRQGKCCIFAARKYIRAVHL